MKNDFTKSDLKVGMKCVDRSSQEFTIGYQPNGVDETSISEIKEDFNDNLTHCLFDDGDIMKVYDENGKLIWERE